jgi:uncharacterized membrane protein
VAARTLGKVVRDTMVGGIVFLVPLLFVALVIGQALDVAARLFAPAVRAMPAFAGYSRLSQTVLSVVSLLLLALLAGMFVRTAPGQRLFKWLETSVLSVIPQFATTRWLVEGIGDEELARLVLVPGDGTLQIGFAFEMEGQDWMPVYLPGAPDWRSGEMILVSAGRLIWPDVSTNDMTLLLGRLGGDQRQTMVELRQMAERLSIAIRTSE